MRNRKILATVIIFLLFGLPSSFIQGKNVRQKTERTIKSLIRKDLLQIKKKNPGLPARNIFIPSSRGMTESSFEFPPDIKKEEISSEDKPIRHSLSLRYIGYIESKQEIVALIIFENEAIAVKEGERISERYTIGDISREAIEIIGPSGEKKQFPFEGEES